LSRFSLSSVFSFIVIQYATKDKRVRWTMPTQANSIYF
jgi:hypothetical protein